MILTVTLNPCVDRTIFVDSLRVSDTNRILRTEIDAGGKGINVSRVLSELGAPTLATGFLGGHTAATVRHVLKKSGIKYEFIGISGETRINVSIEQERGGPPTTLNEKGPPISGEELAAMLNLVPILATSAKWVVLSGSLPPGVPDDIYRTLGESCSQVGQRIVLDSDGPPLREGFKARPHLIKPNAAEAGRLLGREILTVEEALSAATELYEMIGGGDRVAIISLGAEGAVLATNGVCLFQSSPKIESKSSIGSGDSLIAGYLWAREANLDQKEALKWGVAAGAATATTSGAAIGSKPVIESLFATLP